MPVLTITTFNYRKKVSINYINIYLNADGYESEYFEIGRIIRHISFFIAKKMVGLQAIINPSPNKGKQLKFIKLPFKTGGEF